jgi:imidazolonepropionase-like amidohydrolase
MSVTVQPAWKVIRAGALIDGTGSPPRRDVDILIKEDRIVSIAPAGRGDFPHEPVEHIDASTCTVAPGLIDAHFHAGYCGHVGMQQLEWPTTLEYSAVCAGANASQALAHGYTSVLDVGCRGNVAVAVKQAASAGVIHTPTMRVSGQILSTVGGALDLWPRSVELSASTRLTVLVSGEEDIRRVVREQLKAGVDNIKVQLTRSVVQPRGRGEGASFTEGELAACVGMAHWSGMSAAGHAEGPAGIKSAIRAGFDTIHHASFIDTEAIDELEQHPQTRLVFTLGVYRSIIDNGPAVGYEEQARRRVESVWSRMVQGVRTAYDRGVPFAVGSDCGGLVHPHGGYAKDIVLLVQACGLPVPHAIRAATRDGAAAAWLADTGTVEPGKFADLIVVHGNLAEQINRLLDAANFVVVIQRGAIRVDRRPSASRNLLIDRETVASSE